MRSRPVALVVLTLVVAAACSSQARPVAVAPVAAQLSVERFLQAANEHDVEAMGRLFGTSEGALMDTGSTFGCFFKKIGSWFGGNACTRRTDVELRMDAIASIIRHVDYRILREEPVAGRVSPTRRVIVDMSMPRNRTVSGAPFIVVQTGEGRWLVEQVPLEQVMAAR
ncbi:MAG TPA: hypothetical protein VMM35_12895 [Longimicrobiales bacterium]|nr:hypothetical protein [Longimicrobiales bacterium]